MTANLFAKFETAIRDFDSSDLTTLTPLLLERDGALSVFYAPFDYVNRSAKLVLVGITPGRTQMIRALVEARNHLQRGNNPELACQVAKESASFHGMRDNLVAMLDHFGINRLLGIDLCRQLFDERESSVAEHLCASVSGFRV